MQDTKQASSTQPPPRASAATYVAAGRAAAWLAALALALFVFRPASVAVRLLPLAPLVGLALRHWVVRSTAARPAIAASLLSVELAVTTALAMATGGYVGPFTWLYLISVGVAATELGPAGSAWTAGAGVALGALTLVSANGVKAVSGYAFGSGLLVLAAAVHALVPRPADANAEETENAAAVLDEARARAASLEEQNERLRASYRDLTAATREQLARLEDLTAAHDMLSTSVGGGESPDLPERILRAVMRSFEAGGAALWLKNVRGDRLDLRASVGQVAPNIQGETVAVAADSQPSDLRKACEALLRASSPTVAPNPTPRPSSSKDILDVRSETGPEVLASVLRVGDDVIGVLAMSGAPAGRFPASAPERLGTLAGTVSLAVHNLEQTARLSRNVREISLLYEMSNLVQMKTDAQQLYESLVEMVAKLVQFENCTVFIFDPAEGRLVARATRGRVVNLIDHISFEHGSGVSGWVAQRRKQVYISDLTREAGLLNVELIPPRIRSFISVPMVVQENVAGVLNVSHSQANAFTTEDLRVLSILAGQAAITIERTELLRSFERMAITDGLTGVYNHRYFHMRLENEMKRARRYELSLSLMKIDIDRFREINERYGHGTGDMALTQVAALLRRSLRETEILARYGGEEFALILPQTAPEAAVVAAERVRKTVADTAFTAADGSPVSLTISIGLAGFPGHGHEPARILDEADSALVTAKQAGRNRVCVAGQRSAEG